VRGHINPSASEEKNIASMEVELSRLDKRRDAMVDMSSHYKKNRTLRGYEGTPPDTGEEKESRVLAPNEVRRQDPKTGKYIIYDAKTKKALRYEKESK